MNEFDPLFEDMYDYSEAQGLEIDTLIHEDGAAQMEINLRHGDPLGLADQVYLFKRTIREAALAHKAYATFMAKPIADEPGSAMHIHQSVVSLESGRNIFSDHEGAPTPEFFSFIAGHQKYLPAVMCILAPYVNSYRRLTRDSMAPINVQWGYDNRTAGLRIPPPPPMPGGWKTGCPLPMPIPIWSSRPPLPAAISAWWRICAVPIRWKRMPRRWSSSCPWPAGGGGRLSGGRGAGRCARATLRGHLCRGEAGGI